MGSFDWKSIVKSIAPMLGTALGGPLGGMAGAALSKALGTSDAEPDTLAAAIQGATPEQLQAIQKADQDFKVTMATLGFKNEADLEAIAAGDRNSARNREIQVHDHTPAIGFYLITAGFFGLLTAMLFLPIPESNKAVLYTMTGSLGTAWIACVSYYYGTTRSSGVKDQMLYNSTPTDGGKP